MTGRRKVPHEGRHAHLNDLRTFKGVEAWVFDLDNTLYPFDADLFSQINERIGEYVAELLGLDRASAEVQQKAYYKTYGTTLRGLMVEHNVDPDDFLRKAHDIDYSAVKSNEPLKRAISALPGRKFIFTNGDKPHAERTAEALGITDLFEDIFDIVAADLIPKPNRETYELFLKHTGVSPVRAAMFEDLPQNLSVPHKLGMRTVLIVPPKTRELFHGEWEMEDDRAPHVDFVTDDIAGFLNAIPKSL